MKSNKAELSLGETDKQDRQAAWRNQLLWQTYAVADRPERHTGPCSPSCSPDRSNAALPEWGPTWDVGAALNCRKALHYQTRTTKLPRLGDTWVAFYDSPRHLTGTLRRLWLYLLTVRDATSAQGRKTALVHSLLGCPYSSHCLKRAGDGGMNRDQVTALKTLVL